ncbi:aminotransferase class IV [Prolixibacteraceae bacterium Z1-6]|uniref:branched-chain-amino-acid transaminase n=1 Tax=Draconibacterium aestuarii TaxID=2998507 RepID=A0A9X3FA68_9BACT|nr:aminotransferase class IV [Prolixibacteraceae bacterium Z1-6]
MALLPIYKYFCFNDEIKSVSEFVPSENEGGIYEVLRVVNGVPLFLEDHLERFFKSAYIAGKEIKFSSSQIRSFLMRLIETDNVETGNILLSCKTNLKAFFIAHKYPSKEDYKKGVSCGILHAERENPNAKVFQTSVRQQANDLIEASELYEVLLVDKKERITEGSRSNVFFVKGDKIITPKAKKVLLGITRQKTFYCAAELGLVVTEKNVKLNDLAGYDALFITGTSPKILPVKQVAETSFDPKNKVVKILIEKYDFLIDEYIKNA